MTSPKTPTRLSGRTKIITAASIGAVGLASIFAIGANLGILSSTDQTKVGTVAATGDLLPQNPQVTDVYLDTQGNPLPVAPAAPDGSQRFTVDAAGTVDVSVADGTADVGLVTPANGWTASQPIRSGSGATVTFTNDTRTLVFTAGVAADGTASGDVTETSAAAAVPPRTASHEHEDHEHEEHEYEGGDSDD